MIRKLPKPLVSHIKSLYRKEIKGQRERLRKARVKDTKRMELDRIEGFFTRLPIADHRYFTDPQTRKTIDRFIEPGPRQNKRFLMKGNQVRFLNVKRRYPKIGRVIIKRDDNRASGHYTIGELKSIVKQHNKKYTANNSEYIFRAPVAHHVGGLFIAMAEAQYPSLNEILGNEKSSTNLDWNIVKPTQRGIKALEELIRKHNITKSMLHKIMMKVYQRTGLPARNVSLIGVKNGKPILMPLVDIE